MNRRLFNMLMMGPQMALMGSISGSCAEPATKIVVKTGTNGCHLVPRDSKVCILCKKKLGGEELRKARLNRAASDKDLFVSGERL